MFFLCAWAQFFKTDQSDHSDDQNSDQSDTDLVGKMFCYVELGITFKQMGPDHK